ncbi:methyltransferase family protein [Caminibacter pacificus]|jgi:protein-S-isoprenylcysteine O-methyltransferase Ste14
MKFRFLYWIGLLVAVLLADIFFPPPKVFLLSILGILFIIYGVVLNYIAGKTLKLLGHKVKTKKFSPPDKMVKAGIYSCMRHPGQFGNLMILFGVSMLSGKVWSVIFVGWVLAFGLWFILSVEEPEGVEKFGFDYCKYKVEVPPFNFSIKCLVEGYRFLKQIF